jgi:hypothetical protein
MRTINDINFHSLELMKAKVHVGLVLNALPLCVVLLNVQTSPVSAFLEENLIFNHAWWHYDLDKLIKREEKESCGY